jgi:glycine hydroxymethyltransferase
LAEALAREGFRLISGGTDNHLILVDLRTFDEDLTGKEAQEVLDRSGITLNRNTIPDDPRSPIVTSGLRLGTAAETTAGMGAPQMAEIAALMGTALRERAHEEALAHVKESVRLLCHRFPPYPALTGLGGAAAAAAGAGGRGA